MQSGKNINWEHPPLGKYVIGWSISLFGDSPIGWRVASTIAGTLTLAGMGVLGFLWFGTNASVAWIMLVTLFNHFLYVQSRIAMLDTFMFAAMLWSMIFFWKAGLSKISVQKKTIALYASGVLLGIAISFKWFAVVLFLPFLLTQLGSHLFKWSEARKEVSILHVGLALGLVPVLVYFSTFLPLLSLQAENYHFSDLFRMQKLIYEGQKRVVSSHPYMSSWTGWLIPIRPIWYAFDKEGPGGAIVRGVFLVGNPLVMWSGLIALLVCFWDSLHAKNTISRWIVGLFLLFWLSWAIIPRKIVFYYYYYPAAMMLTFSMAHFFSRFKLNRMRWVYLGAVMFLFLWFFPVLSGMPIPTESFRQWMWLDSWI